MKQNGINVAADFLLNLNLTGCRGGLVIVVADDPGGISSTNEEDSRIFAKLSDLPLLEPATFQEAKDMTRWAFTLSEDLELPVMLRSVTRLSHARGNVRLDALPRSEPKAHFETSRPRLAFPPVPCHKVLHQKLDRASAMAESSPYNFYRGPEKPEVLIITSGSGWMYSLETVSTLKLQDRVGLLKLSTTWPLPRNLVLKHLKQADAILFVEEVDPFLENNVKELFAQHCMDLGLKRFYGKATGTVSSFGEITPEIVTSALERLLNVSHEPRPAEYAEKAREVMTGLVPARALGFCAGCPHRATYWAIKKSPCPGRPEGLCSETGCYGLGMGPSDSFR
jgi:indolepyruvate ferredoxin oxidoreductase alpha subunit